MHRFCLACSGYFCFFFFFNDTATTEIYTLSLHDALPISAHRVTLAPDGLAQLVSAALPDEGLTAADLDTCCYGRSEEHTSELQSRLHLVCRLLLEKKKKTKIIPERSVRHRHK